MTLENITPERIDRIEQLLYSAAQKFHAIRFMAGRGDITIRQAAAEINRIGAEIEKAIYPEDEEA